jgi:hypothetical protein
VAAEEVTYISDVQRFVAMGLNKRSEEFFRRSICNPRESVPFGKEKKGDNSLNKV